MTRKPGEKVTAYAIQPLISQSDNKRFQQHDLTVWLPQNQYESVRVRLENRLSQSKQTPRHLSMIVMSGLQPNPDPDRFVCDAAARSYIREPSLCIFCCLDVVASLSRYRDVLVLAEWNRHDASIPYRGFGEAQAQQAPGKNGTLQPVDLAEKKPWSGRTKRHRAIQCRRSSKKLCRTF
jgi:hypothetical protein